jgi:hypothetical protein
MIVTRSKRHGETDGILIKRSYTDNVYTIQSFFEKSIIRLEYPDVVGIYSLIRKSLMNQKNISL